MSSVVVKKQRYGPIVLTILGAWTLFALFFSTQVYLNIIYHGRSQPFANVLIPWLTCGYLWAALTPLTLWLSRTRPRRGPTRTRGGPTRNTTNTRPTRRTQDAAPSAFSLQHPQYDFRFDGRRRQRRQRNVAASERLVAGCAQERRSPRSHTRRRTSVSGKVPANRTGTLSRPAPDPDRSCS